MVLSAYGKRFIKKSTSIAALVMGLISLGVTAVLYSRLPETIPVHWNVRGEVDDYGPRYLAWVIGALPLLIYLLMRFLPTVDPRRKNYEKSARAYNAAMIGIVALMMVLQLLILGSAAGFDLRVDMFVKAAVGVLFVVIGNYMGTIRSNFFFGIKTPWTLSSDEVWRKTHRLGGALFILAGLSFIGAAFIRGILSALIPLAMILAAVAVPIGYSYFLYRRMEQDAEK